MSTALALRFARVTLITQNGARRRTFRLLMGVLAICALMGTASAARAAPLAAAVAPGTAELDVIPDGDGTVSPDPLPAGGANCVGSPNEGLNDVATHCSYVYAPGQQVTLTATPNAAGVRFEGWSDERCTGTGPCTLPMDADLQSVAALFSPQRLVVKTATAAGVAGTVKVQGGNQCKAAPDLNAGELDCGNFHVLTQVTLEATPPQTNPPTDTTWDGTLCDPPEPGPVTRSTCTVSIYRLTWASVGFGVDPPSGIPPAISVRFRVLKRGSGSGTVRGGPINCGSSCVSPDLDFGTRETLVADPDPGSTFVGWRGACSSAPRCSLAVGPVTALVAVFDASASSTPSTSSSTSESPTFSPVSQPSRPGTRFVARLRRIAVTGHGRHRTIFMRVQVNAPATIRATLSRGHRRLATRRWRVRAGSPLLRLHVPARTRRGVYGLALSLRDSAGHATQVKRRVRLPR